MSDTAIHSNVFVEDLALAVGGTGAAETGLRRNSTGALETLTKIDATYLRLRDRNISIQDYLYENQFNVKDRGAVGDGVVDDTAAIQATIDAAIATGGKSIYLPIGTYKITDTLKLNYGVDYAGFTFRGDGSFGTIIDASSFGDRPALNIQGARHMVLKDFKVSGKNLATITAADTLDPVMANWITSGCSNTQYAPYAGICVDAYQGTKPTGGYSNDVYGRKDSSYITMANVVVSGFVVGLCVSPANISNDSDQISVNECEFVFNTFGYSCGGSQSRSVVFRSTDVFGNWCCFTTLRHGQKIGNHPSINGGIFQTSHKIFELGAANGANPATIAGMHAESIGWLGELGVSDSGSSIPIGFYGCNISFSGSAYQPFLLVAHRKANFDACHIQFVDDGTGAGYAINLSGSRYYGLTQFDTCNFIGLADSIYTAVGIRANNFTSQSLRNCSVEDSGNTDAGSVGRYNINRDVDIDGMDWTYYLTRYFISPNAANVNIQGKAYKITRPNDYGWNSSGFSISAPVLSGTTHGSTLTFTASNPAEFHVGDLIMWRVYEPYDGVSYYTDVPALRVTANNAGACTAVVMFNGIDAAYASGLTGLYVYSPFFVNPTESTGTTNSNTSVTSVTNVTNWAIGDFVQGAGIPVDTRIANIVGTTITLSKAATDTDTGVALYNCKLNQITHIKDDYSYSFDWESAYI